METLRLVVILRQFVAAHQNPLADEQSGVVRDAHQEELPRLVESVTAGLPPAMDERGRRETAWALLAQLAGGVMLARAVADPSLAKEIAAAVRANIK